MPGEKLANALPAGGSSSSFIPHPDAFHPTKGNEIDGAHRTVIQEAAGKLPEVHTRGIVAL